MRFDHDTDDALVTARNLRADILRDIDLALVLLLLLACEKSTMTRAARPAAAMSAQHWSTLAAS